MALHYVNYLVGVVLAYSLMAKFWNSFTNLIISILFIHWALSIVFYILGHIYDHPSPKLI